MARRDLAEAESLERFSWQLLRDDVGHFSSPRNHPGVLEFLSLGSETGLKIQGLRTILEFLLEAGKFPTLTGVSLKIRIFLVKLRS